MLSPSISALKLRQIAADPRQELSTEMLQTYIAAGNNINAYGESSGQTALHRAILANQRAKALLLVTHGADIFFQSDKHRGLACPILNLVGIAVNDQSQASNPTFFFPVMTQIANAQQFYISLIAKHIEVQLSKIIAEKQLIKTEMGVSDITHICTEIEDLIRLHFMGQFGAASQQPASAAPIAEMLLVSECLHKGIQAGCEAYLATTPKNVKGNIKICIELQRIESGANIIFAAANMLIKPNTAVRDRLARGRHNARSGTSRSRRI